MEKMPARETNGKSDKMPLLDRIYFRELYTSLVRGVGYPGIPVADGRKLVETLAKTYDKEKIVKAADELFDIDAKEVKLKANVRKLCFMLLGPPPDHKETTVAEMLGPFGNREPPKPEEKPKRPRKRQQVYRWFLVLLIKEKTGSPPSPCAMAVLATPPRTEKPRLPKQERRGLLLAGCITP